MEERTNRIEILQHYINLLVEVNKEAKIEHNFDIFRDLEEKNLSCLTNPELKSLFQVLATKFYKLLRCPSLLSKSQSKCSARFCFFWHSWVDRRKPAACGKGLKFESCPAGGNCSENCCKLHNVYELKYHSTNFWKEDCGFEAADDDFGCDTRGRFCPFAHQEK
mmetsp:Transcript_34084/g.38723  ORF Transcript_34084/g.38723 Transcript_34084/m.38723 type:complete len:164 (-) Transcript_34084:345-836(-)